MAIRQGENHRLGVMRTSYGQFKLHGDDDNTRLTIPKSLDTTRFPNDTGDEVELILIENEDQGSYLEVHPTRD